MADNLYNKINGNPKLNIQTWEKKLEFGALEYQDLNWTNLDGADAVSQNRLLELIH